MDRLAQSSRELGTLKYRYEDGNTRFGKVCAKLKGKSKTAENYSRFMMLRKLASETHDFETELNLFALEMKSKRFHKEKRLINLSANYIYEGISDYGRSIIRPALFLFLLFVVFLLSYGILIFDTPLSYRNLVFTFYKTLPVLPTPEINLFPKPLTTTHILLFGIHKMLSLIGFFFLFLGMRNIFRVK